MKKFVIHTPTKKLLKAVLDYIETQPKLKLDRKSHNLHSYGEKHCVDIQDEDEVMYGDTGYFSNEGYDIISGELFLSIVGVNFRNTTTVQLNKEYKAEIDLYSQSVKVGCQTFEFEAIERLHKAITE
jgi:hypothetical protein